MFEDEQQWPGEHIPAFADSGCPFSTDWNHLSQWGGFSPEGFHSVIITLVLNETWELAPSRSGVNP